VNEKVAIIVTSIAAPNLVLKTLALGCSQKNYHFIVIGDSKSPPDFHIDGCEFYSLQRQKELGFKFPQLCPTKHYARKNIGYLIAIASGASVIIETDDDNIPYDDFWKPRCLSQSTAIVEKPGWFNVYRYFTDANIWPRGLALDHIHDTLPAYESLVTSNMDCPIQQGLADDNPDVDAVYRLTAPGPQKFRKDRRVFLAPNTWCPFNSQNTTWFPQAFGLMYLPAYSSFRMTDIWRSFIAQRIAWANGWGILFHEPTVRQERNVHNLMKDFEDEIPGYLHNSEICSQLYSLSLKAGAANVTANVRRAYEKIVQMSLLDSRELDLVDAWIEDLEQIRKCR